MGITPVPSRDVRGLYEALGRLVDAGMGDLPLEPTITSLDVTGMSVALEADRWRGTTATASAAGSSAARDLDDARRACNDAMDRLDEVESRLSSASLALGRTGGVR